MPPRRSAGFLRHRADDLNWFENLRYTLSVPDLQFNTISIYPNPTTHSLNFKGLTSDTTVTVADILGKNVMNYSLQNGEALDVSNLASGLYVVRLEGVNQTFKFIKE